MRPVCRDLHCPGCDWTKCSAGQRLGAGRVDPGQPALDADAGLVRADHIGPAQPVGHRLVELLESGRGGGVPRRQRPLRHRGVEQVGEQFGAAGQRQVLGGQQIGGHPAQPGPVLGRRADTERRRGHRGVAAAAAAVLENVLDHPQRDPGQVEHLAGLDGGHRRLGQRPPAARAGLRGVDHPLIRLGDLAQRAALVPGLTTRGPVGDLPARAWGRLPIALRRGQPGGTGPPPAGAAAGLAAGGRPADSATGRRPVDETLAGLEQAWP